MAFKVNASTLPIPTTIVGLLIVPTGSPAPRLGISFTHFVVLIASLMALSALGIDSMLPALQTISRALGFDDGNRRQWIITAYMLGFGTGQIVYGTFADRFGRRPVLLVGLAIYVLFSLGAAFSSTFPMIVAARALQGAGAAATRVVPISIVRDCYAGRQMARVMSLTSIVFMAVPILAPSLGQAIVSVAPWQWEFGVLALGGISVLAWATAKLPETLHPDDRLPIEPRRILSAFGIVLRDRTGMGYTIGGALVFSAIIGFVNCAQQLFTDFFHAPRMFPIVFACVAAFIAIASLVNARLVGRLGSRLISHTALVAFIAISAIHATIAITGHETLITFTVMQGAGMFMVGLVSGNFGAMAMEQVGHLAGTASSVQGFISMISGALLGFTIGQQFNGTAVPLTIGYVLCGIAALGAVAFAERGRLFTPHEMVPASAE